MTKTDKLVSFIREHVAKHGHGPTADQMARASGMTKAHVGAELVRLRDQKVLAWKPRDYSTLKVLSTTKAVSSADSRSSDGCAKLLDAIRAGKVRSLDDAASASGLEKKSVNAAMQRLVQRGLITYEKLHAKAIDWDSLSVTDGKPIKVRAVAPSKAKRGRRVVVEKSAPPATVPVAAEVILDRPALLLDAAEIARIRALVVQARAACDELETLASTAERSPTFRTYLRASFASFERWLQKSATGASVSAIDLWQNAGAAPAPVVSPTPGSDEEDTTRLARKPRRRRARKLPELLEDVAPDAAGPVAEDHDADEDLEEEVEPDADSADVADEDQEQALHDEQAEAEEDEETLPRPPFKALAGVGEGRTLSSFDTIEAAARYFERFPGCKSVIDARGEIVRRRAA